MKCRSGFAVINSPGKKESHSDPDSFYDVTRASEA
jgi:hypothetical protein